MNLQQRNHHHLQKLEIRNGNAAAGKGGDGGTSQATLSNGSTNAVWPTPLIDMVTKN